MDNTLGKGPVTGGMVVAVEGRGGGVVEREVGLGGSVSEERVPLLFGKLSSGGGEILPVLRRCVLDKWAFMNSIPISVRVSSISRKVTSVKILKIHTSPINAQAHGTISTSSDIPCNAKKM